MANLEKTMKILHGTKDCEFESDTKLKITDWYTKESVTLDLANFTEEMHDEMRMNDIDYEDAMQIFNSLKMSKRTMIEGPELTVIDKQNGDMVVINLAFLTEDMYEKLLCEEAFNDDLEDDFTDAVNSIKTEENLSK